MQEGKAQGRTFTDFKLSHLNSLTCFLKWFLRTKYVGYCLWEKRAAYCLARKMFSIAMWKKIFLKERGFKNWHYCLLVEEMAAAVAGKGERVVFKCVCFWVWWLSASLPLWVCVAEWVSDRVQSALYKWIGVWGQPPQPTSTWNTHFFTAPPSGDQAPLHPTPKSVYYLPSYSDTCLCL